MCVPIFSQHLSPIQKTLTTLAHTLQQLSVSMPNLEHDQYSNTRLPSTSIHPLILPPTDTPSSLDHISRARLNIPTHHVSPQGAYTPKPTSNTQGPRLRTTDLPHARHIGSLMTPHSSTPTDNPSPLSAASSSHPVQPRFDIKRMLSKPAGSFSHGHSSSSSTSTVSGSSSSPQLTSRHPRPTAPRHESTKSVVNRSVDVLCSDHSDRPSSSSNKSYLPSPPLELAPHTRRHEISSLIGDRPLPRPSIPHDHPTGTKDPRLKAHSSDSDSQSRSADAIPSNVSLADDTIDISSASNVNNHGLTPAALIAFEYRQREAALREARQATAGDPGRSSSESAASQSRANVFEGRFGGTVVAFGSERDGEYHLPPQGPRRSGSSFGTGEGSSDAQHDSPLPGKYISKRLSSKRPKKLDLSKAVPRPANGDDDPLKTSTPASPFTRERSATWSRSRTRERDHTGSRGAASGDERDTRSRDRPLAQGSQGSRGSQASSPPSHPSAGEKTPVQPRHRNGSSGTLSRLVRKFSISALKDVAAPPRSNSPTSAPSFGMSRQGSSQSHISSRYGDLTDPHIPPVPAIPAIPSTATSTPTRPPPRPPQNPRRKSSAAAQQGTLLLDTSSPPPPSLPSAFSSPASYQSASSASPLSNATSESGYLSRVFKRRTAPSSPSPISTSSPNEPRRSESNPPTSSMRPQNAPPASMTKSKTLGDSPVSHLSSLPRTPSSFHLPASILPLTPSAPFMTLSPSPPVSSVPEGHGTMLSTLEHSVSPFAKAAQENYYHALASASSPMPPSSSTSHALPPLPPSSPMPITPLPPVSPAPSHAHAHTVPVQPSNSNGPALLRKRPSMKKRALMMRQRTNSSPGTPSPTISTFRHHATGANGAGATGAGTGTGKSEERPRTAGAAGSSGAWDAYSSSQPGSGAARVVFREGGNTVGMSASSSKGAASIHGSAGGADRALLDLSATGERKKTQDEKLAMWDELMKRSDRAPGGTLHARITQDRLASDDLELEEDQDDAISYSG